MTDPRVPPSPESIGQLVHHVLADPLPSDGPPYTHTVRHPDPNVEDDPRDLLDAYAAEQLDDDYRHSSRESFAPAAFTALRAVLDQHPMVYLDEGFVCHRCTHLTDDKPTMWPCPTVQVITNALEAE